MTTNQCEDNAEEFEDAIENLDSSHADRSAMSPTTNDMTLEKSLVDSKRAVNLFFNNKFEEARAIMESSSSTSFYHALGCSVFSFLQAMLTFEQKDMEVASEVVKHSIELSSQFRRKNTVSESFGRLLKKTDYDAFTEDQIHAELCYAESLLFKAVLTFTEDENLISFVKGGLKIRSCYHSYKECWHILNNRKWTNDPHKIHFESGVRLGAGAFSLLVSLLPQRVLKLLEFIGFNGSKSSRDMGLRELEKGYEQQDSIRRVMCAMIILGYHLLVLYVLGTGEGDLKQARSILDEQLTLYPNGAWFLFFQGRLEFVQAHIDEAIQWYDKSWKSQNIWPQFHHICYWELMWAHSLKLDWHSAGDYAQRLFNESKWSKCIYAYQKAAFMCMLKDEQSLTGDDHRLLVKLMKEVPAYKQRIAGKSLPMEKFAVKKSARYFAQNERLCLPALELIYVWNGIRIMGKDWTLIQNSYRLVERSFKDIEKRKNERYYWDDLALALLLKGCCLRYMGSPLQAEECFLKVTKMDKQIVDDHYLIPYCVAELGFLYQSLEKNEQAIVWLEAAKNNYKGYSLESRLHFRLHSALTQLRSSSSGDRPNAELVMGLDDGPDQTNGEDK